MTQPDRTPSTPPSFALLLAAAAAAVCSGCGVSVYRPAARFDINDQRHIDDRDIQRAFAARPQMKLPTRVAFFSFAPGREAAINEAIRSVAGVAKTYPLPPFIVTGQRRFDRARRHARSHRTPSLKKMRLLAARARCDLLVIFDYGHRIRRKPNWLIGFSVLLLPSLFLPYLDEQVDSYLTAYVIDVRNGYLYGQVTADQKKTKRYSTIYSAWGDDTARSLWGRLLGDTRAELAKLLSKQAAVSKVASAASTARGRQ